MADNYLERQREDYEARKAAMLKKKKKRTKPRLSEEMRSVGDELRKEHL